MPEWGSLSLGSVSHFCKGQTWLGAQGKHHTKPFSPVLGSCYSASHDSFFPRKVLPEVTQEQSAFPGHAELTAEHRGFF